ncbi:hypothetical protein HOS33_gp223 [Erwinia phage vB_EamM_Y3]|uniref:Uncharacterized protein n=1 Tax=Erwinia phage vB_EamM_Y3 TaxID=1983553 RepID=A0A2H4IBD7_9CAUD|nr:hypothetical protein HOS33_gp223 [Erwinia phage vB_EamM_Y3]ARW58863.1 hypothetical protein Y3_223 [Erwinia phage vB_EamM_Y3]
MINEKDVTNVITEVLKGFGEVLFLDRGHTGKNDATYSTHETQISCTIADNADADTFGEMFFSKFSDQLEEYRKKTTGTDAPTNPTLIVNNPVYTYREPQVLSVPNGRTLIAVSVGFPFIVDPALPRMDL